MQINGNYRAVLPIAGRTFEVVFALNCADGLITGTMANPHSPEDLCPITGRLEGDAFQFTAQAGRTVYTYRGTVTAQGLAFDLQTNERIPLDPGKRLAGTTGELAGEYLVGVYSPGGVKENHFVIRSEGETLSGEMFCMFDPNAPMGGPNGAPAEAQRNGPPEGMPPGGAPMGPDELGRVDVNAFQSGHGSAEGFAITVLTAQGSEFLFRGQVAGDIIQMDMYVTDRIPDQTAARV